MIDKKKETISNHAALRDACLACLKRIDETLPYTDSGMVLTGLINHIKETLQNALKEPPRNCDRFNSLYDAVVAWGCEDQGWNDWPDEDAEDENDLINILSGDQEHELIDWLFDMVTEGGK